VIGESIGRRPDNRVLCGLVKDPWRCQAVLALTDRRANFGWQMPRWVGVVCYGQVRYSGKPSVEELAPLKSAVEPAHRRQLATVTVRDGKGNAISGDDLPACYHAAMKLTPDLRPFRRAFLPFPATHTNPRSNLSLIQARGSSVDPATGQRPFLAMLQRSLAMPTPKRGRLTELMNRIRTSAAARRAFASRLSLYCVARYDDLGRPGRGRRYSVSYPAPGVPAAAFVVAMARRCFASGLMH
jgi:hypothetical protein